MGEDVEEATLKEHYAHWFNSMHIEYTDNYGRANAAQNYKGSSVESSSESLSIAL